MPRVRAHPGVARWVAWAVVSALFVVASAEVWHHHTPWGHPHPDCPVCVAMHQPSVDDSPPIFTAPPPAPVALVGDAPARAIAPVAPPPAHARAPPARPVLPDAARA